MLSIRRKAYRILVRKSNKREHLEDLGVDSSDIRRDNKGRRCERGDRMYLAQDRAKWRAVLNTVMNNRALLHVISLVKRLKPVVSLCSPVTLSL